MLSEPSSMVHDQNGAVIDMTSTPPAATQRTHVPSSRSHATRASSDQHRVDRATWNTTTRPGSARAV